MKKIGILMCLVLLTGIAWGQERIPSEFALKVAQLLAEQTAKLENTQVKVEPDVNKPFGLKKEEVGALVIPDKGLTTAALKNAGKEVVPVGRLWVRHLTVLIK